MGHDPLDYNQHNFVETESNGHPTHSPLANKFSISLLMDKVKIQVAVQKTGLVMQ